MYSVALMERSVAAAASLWVWGATARPSTWSSSSVSPAFLLRSSSILLLQAAGRQRAPAAARAPSRSIMEYVCGGKPAANVVCCRRDDVIRRCAVKLGLPGGTLDETRWESTGGNTGGREYAWGEAGGELGQIWEHSGLIFVIRSRRHLWKTTSFAQSSDLLDQNKTCSVQRLTQVSPGKLHTYFLTNWKQASIYIDFRTAAAGKKLQSAWMVLPLVAQRSVRRFTHAYSACSGGNEAKRTFVGRWNETG